MKYPRGDIARGNTNRQILSGDPINIHLTFEILTKTLSASSRLDLRFDISETQTQWGEQANDKQMLKAAQNSHRKTFEISATATATAGN